MDSLVGCLPERRWFLVPAGQLRGLAAYCTAGVRRRAQTRAYLGGSGSCADVGLPVGTCAATQSTRAGSRRITVSDGVSSLFGRSGGGPSVEETARQAPARLPALREGASSRTVPQRSLERIVPWPGSAPVHS